MKKIIGIIFISLMFANIGFAEMSLIEEKKIKAKHFNYYISTFCIDGYKFVSFLPSSSSLTPAISMVQFYIRDRTSGITILERY